MMNVTGDASSKRQRAKQGVSRTKLIGWLGLLPFAVFMTLFLVIPVLFNFWRSLHDSSGAWSLQPLRGIFAPEYLNAYVNTIKFQIPLMAVLIMPPILGLKKEWSESSAALGASALQTLMRVTIPVLTPAIIGTMLLLFANAFAAYATAYALSGGSANLIAIMVGVFLTGNVFVDENFGAALIVGMIAIILVAFIMRSVLERRTAKWLQ